MSSHKQNITLDDASPLLSYEGWADVFLAPPDLNYYDNTIRYTIINGSSIQLTFIGTGIWVYPGQPWGSWHVTLDGVQQGTFSAARQVQDDRFQLVYSATDLNLTSHTLFITVGVSSAFIQELMPEIDRMVAETLVEGTRSIVHASDITTWTHEWTNTADYYYTSTSASFSYTFQGNAIEVWGPVLEYGHFTVKLDNQPLFSAPTYAGNPGNVLQIPSLLQFQAAGLDNSINHTIVIANNPGAAATKYAFGFFNIYSLNNTSPSTSSTSTPSLTASSSTASSSIPSSSSQSSSLSSHTAAIAGGVVGGTLLLAVCILLYLRRRRARSSSSGRLHRTVSLDMSLSPVPPTPEPYQYRSTSSPSAQITSKLRAVNSDPSPDSPVTDLSLPPPYDDLSRV